MAARVLMNHSAKRVWLRPEVMPIIGVMGVGGAWLSFVSSRYLFVSPDTQWSRESRGNMWRTNFSEGNDWQRHRSMWAVDKKDVGHTSVMGMQSVNKWIGGSEASQ